MYDKIPQNIINRVEVPRLEKVYLQKSYSNIILNGEREGAFLLRSGIKQECLLLSLQLSITVEVPSSAIRKEL